MEWALHIQTLLFPFYIHKVFGTKLREVNGSFSFICIERHAGESHASFVASLYFFSLSNFFFPQKNNGIFSVASMSFPFASCILPNPCYMPIRYNKVCLKKLPGFLILIHGEICLSHRIKSNALWKSNRINSPLWSDEIQPKEKYRHNFWTLTVLGNNCISNTVTLCQNFSALLSVD